MGIVTYLFLDKLDCGALPKDGPQRPIVGLLRLL